MSSGCVSLTLTLDLVSLVECTAFHGQDAATIFIITGGEAGGWGDVWGVCVGRVARYHAGRGWGGTVTPVVGVARCGLARCEGAVGGGGGGQGVGGGGRGGGGGRVAVGRGGRGAGGGGGAVGAGGGGGRGRGGMGAEG